MQGNPLIEGLSDLALAGAINSLMASGEWRSRLRELLDERRRRRNLPLTP